jgi:hypothetical protein
MMVLRNQQGCWIGPKMNQKQTPAQCFRCYREEGFRALYKGFAPKVLLLGPGGGVLLVCDPLRQIG